MSSVVIIGGHGKVALLATPMLVKAGHRVTSVVRNPDHAADVTATGSASLVADVEKLSVEELTELLLGHDVVVWSAGAGGGSPERTYAVDRDAAMRSMDAVSAAGGARYVMVSYFGAGADHGVLPDNPFFAYAEAKAAADAHLTASDLVWTILRPSGLTDGPAGGVETGDGISAAQVPRATVAQVIASAVDNPDTTSNRIVAFNSGDQPVDAVFTN